MPLAFRDGDIPNVTFCLWRQIDDDRWRTGRIEFPSAHSDPDGSGWMFDLLLDPRPEAFQSFAEDHYERPVDLDAVRHICEQRSLTGHVVARLNPDVSFADVVREAKDIGYPV